MRNFVPGLKLSQLFYEREIKPILDHAFPQFTDSTDVLEDLSLIEKLRAAYR